MKHTMECIRSRCSLSSMLFVMLLSLLQQQPRDFYCFAWVTTTTTSSPVINRSANNSRLQSTKMFIDSTAAVNTKYLDMASSVLSRLSFVSTPLFAPPQIDIWQQPKQSSKSRKITTTDTVIEHTHGMPWKQSISKQYNDDHAVSTTRSSTATTAATAEGLFYMPFYEWQVSFMKQQLTNVKALPVVSKNGKDMSYVQNANATMRMHTSAYSSNEYEYVRCTTVDGGHQLQVFTSLWYPRNTLLPVLGIDLLQFNHGKKTLCIVDFQPVVPPDTRSDASDNVATAPRSNEYFESKLKVIRDQYPSLQNEMTNRFYSSDDPYFSKQMLLGRVQHHPNNTIDEIVAETRDMVYDDLYPAYQQYVQTHVQLQKESLRQQQVDQREVIHRYHAQYDTYSAQRDPAHKLLAHAFGQEYADDYVYDILFPLATTGRDTE